VHVSCSKETDKADSPKIAGKITLYEGWVWRHKASIVDTASNDKGIIKVDSKRFIHAIRHGVDTLVIKIFENNKFRSALLIVEVVKPKLAPVHEEIPKYLSEPANDFVEEFPVVIIRFLPTRDGHLIDNAYSPNYFELNQTTVSEITDRIDHYDARMKFALEQGTRFRQYKNPQARPYLGFKVVDYITVYEPMPPGEKLEGYDNGALQYAPDYKQIFDRFNIREMVEKNGVRQIWMWYAGVNQKYPSYNPVIHKPENFRGASESNMSSPITGDISNSYRIPDDLPVYSKPYVVVHHFWQRTQTTNMEPHLHQYESMWLHINRQLFWDKFVGTIGRCGWTHMPPNTTTNYGYFHYLQEKTPAVLSDIEDWTPDETGEKKLIDRHAWEDLKFDWPDGVNEFEERLELQWFIYWMQSIPGYQNNIPHGQNGKITNWWEFILNWDDCAGTKKNLFTGDN
jgi:hypothetical protein